MDKLFEAARGLNPLLPERALRAAADIVGKQLTSTEIYRADAVRCVELAGAFLEYESAGDEGTVPVASSQVSSTADFLKQEYLLAIDPAVREVRSRYFGQESAPFKDDYGAAVEWLDAARKREEKLHRPTREPANADAARKAEEKLHEAAREPTDAIEYFERRLRTAQDALEAHQESLAELAHTTDLHRRVPYDDEAGRMRFFGYGTASPLHELAELVRAVAWATGFLEREVVRYVLCGDEPLAVRIQGTTREVVGRVGGARIDRVEVTLRIQSPDLSQADLHEIRTFVRQAWTPLEGVPPLRFEEKDEILRRLLIELGDDGSRRRRGFWPDLLARWKEEVGDPDATVAQLKMREQRLQKKLRQLKREGTT